MTARRVLVTGATGFVGASLARRLIAEDHHVELVVRPGSDPWRLEDFAGAVVVHYADLRDEATTEQIVNAARPDWIFHLAAHGGSSWQTNARTIFESNVLGTLNLAQACVRRGFDAFVQAGSSSEYGLKDHAPSEGENPEPNSDYAVAKVAATLLCRRLAIQHGLHLVTLRLYSAYGPWEDPRRLMPTLVAYGLRGELPPLVAPDTARDFVYIDDVCHAFLLAALKSVPGSSGIYNVGSGTQTSLKSLIELAQRVLNFSVVPEWGSHEARSWDTSVWVADSSKILHELGWQPQCDLETGLASLSTWLADRPALGERYDVRTDLGSSTK